MLNKHLIAACYPKADPDNIVMLGNYRVTVLSDRLFRIECDKDSVFTDEATQSIWYRNMPKVDFKVTDDGDFLKISTAKVTLCLGKTIDKSYIMLDSNRVAINNCANLLGTCRTLDCCDGNVDVNNSSDGPISLDPGVVSKNGVAVIDDTNSLILKEDGRIYPRRKTECDLYVFAYGHDYRGALGALYMISGPVPKIPKFALGNWWSRYYDYTDKSYLHLLDRFDKTGVPLTVATVDMDWHYSENLEKYFELPEEEPGTKRNWHRGWTGYTWNKHLFPDYKAFLKNLKKRNLKVTLNLHPADGIRYFEDCYENMAKAMGVDPATKRDIPFDMTDDNFINNYFDIIHKPYERDGVQFWWIDWQQGTKSALSGLDPLWALNHYHYLDNAKEKEPLILSRYSGIGSHRYPLGFSGDTLMSWKSLEYIPYFTATASNAGYTWWSHDIGGHISGIKDDELNLRYVQFGVFSPINRLHCQKSEVITKEPWAFMNGTGLVVQNYLRLRHKMIPFIYSASIRNHKMGISLIEPMYYEYPESPEAYKFTNQYLFGGQLIVAPVTSKANAQGLAKTKVWLPEGQWTDVFTGDIYNGGRVVDTYRYFEEMPVFAKAGGVFVTSEDNSGNSLANPVRLAIDVYNGNGTYEFYEDDPRCGKEAVTTITNTYEIGKQITHLSVIGNKGVVPKMRVYILRFPNIRSGEATVTAKGGKVNYTYDDNGSVCVTVSGKTTDFTVEVSFTPEARLECIKRSATRKITAMQGENDYRARLYEAMMATESIEEFVALIESANIKSTYKKQLLELV